MIYQVVRRVQQAAWADVQPSIQRLRKLKYQVENCPELMTPKERKTAVRPWNRLLVEETVWSVARTRNLLMPEQLAVIEAAKKWMQSWPTGEPNEQDNPEDIELYKAIETLIASTEELSEPSDSIDSAAN